MRSKARGEESGTSRGVQVSFLNKKTLLILLIFISLRKKPSSIAILHTESVHNNKIHFVTLFKDRLHKKAAFVYREVFFDLIAKFSM